MPRRAYFVFHQRLSALIASVFARFNAPKGWIYFLSVILAATASSVLWEFQCPEGLNLFSIKPLGNSERAVITFQCPEGLNLFSIPCIEAQPFLQDPGFNAPKGWIYFLSCAGLHGLGRGAIRFNAPKGWIYFLSGPLFWWLVRVILKWFQCPEGLNLFSIAELDSLHRNLRRFVSFNAPKGWIYFLSTLIGGTNV